VSIARSQSLTPAAGAAEMPKAFITVRPVVGLGPVGRS